MEIEVSDRGSQAKVGFERSSTHSSRAVRQRRSRRRRVQLDLLSEVYDRVARIQVLNGLESVRTVFREAFRFYEWYTVRRLEGWSIQLVHRDGRVAYVDLGLDGEPSNMLPDRREVGQGREAAWPAAREGVV